MVLKEYYQVFSRDLRLSTWQQLRRLRIRLSVLKLSGRSIFAFFTQSGDAQKPWESANSVTLVKSVAQGQISERVLKH